MSIYDNELYLDDIKTVALYNRIDWKKFNNTSFLITGASGLICSFLVDVLMYRNTYCNDNIKIYMLCRNESKLKERFSKYDLRRIDDESNGKLTYIIQDVCEPFNFELKVDYIIHAASNTHPKLYSSDPVGTITTNVIGLNNMLKFAVRSNSKRVFMMSSVEIYGENRGDVDLFNEEYLGYLDCNTMRSGYPESKRLCEALCQSYIYQYNLNVVIGRLCRVYGPTLLKDDSKALSQFIKNAVNNEDIVLKSEGNQFFSYLYMSDIVKAVILLLDKGANGECYNISHNSSNITLRNLAGILADYNNKKVIFQIPEDSEKKGYSTATIAVMDSSKIEKLGWNPTYDIKKGLERTIDIIQNKL